MMDQAVIDIQKHNNKINRILNKISESNPGLTQQIDLALYSSLKIQKILKKLLQQKKSRYLIDKQAQLQGKNSNICKDEQDQLYENALKVIQGFKSATKTLQKKVGILIREQEIMKHGYGGMSPYYQARPYPTKSYKNLTTKPKQKQHISPSYNNTSPFSPNIITSSSNSKQKYMSSGSKGKINNKQSASHNHLHPHQKYNEKIHVRQYINQEQLEQQQEQKNLEYNYDYDVNQEKSKNISQLDQQIIELASEIKHIMKGK